MPSVLPTRNGVLQKAGAAPEPGGTRFLNLTNATSTTVFEAIVISTGAYYSIVAVRGNQVLNRVRLDHTVVYGGEKAAVGDGVLVSGIKMDENGPVATTAWPIATSSTHNGNDSHQRQSLPPPRPARHIGVVCRVHASGGFGEVLEEGTGARFFAHGSQFQGGARLAEGCRVAFTPAKTPRGAAALAIIKAA